MDVRGAAIDAQTRCIHWRSELDVIAIEFACCRQFYPCRACHDDDTDHHAQLWPVTQRDRPAILCGVCRARIRIDDYLAAGDACSSCSAPFNPDCRLHHHLYFAGLAAR